MYIVLRPTICTSERRICEFHKKHPGHNFPGCTCSCAISSREKTLEEMTEDEKKNYFAALKGEKPDGSPLF
jgi:hypothetical protein